MRVAPILLALAVAVSGCGSTATTHRPSRPGTVPASSDPAAARTASSTGAATTDVARTPRLRVRLAPWHLPAPIAREAVAGAGPVVTLAGGLRAGDRSTAAAYRLDLRTGRSTALPPMRVPVHDTAGARLGSDVVVVGGGNAAEQDVVQRLHGGRWTVAGHLPRARSDLSIAEAGGRVVVLGGYDGTTTAESSILASTDGVRWRSIGTLPVGVRYAASAVVDGRVLVFGGERAGVMRTEIQSVDASGHATVIGRLPVPLGHAMALTIGRRVLIAGGRTGADTITDRMWWFDPGDGAVSKAGRLPRPLADAGVATDADGSYLLGGESPADVASVVRISLG